MKKYKIAVLAKLDDSSETTLKGAISLAKMINGKIEVFSVKKPIEVVDRESQLSAVRTINNQQLRINKQIQILIDKVSDDDEIEINYSYTIGNLKNEIESFIKEKQPDIVVLGKRKSKVLNFIGDNVAQIVLNTFNGVVMITTDKHPMKPNKEISFGMLNNLESSFNLEFSKELIGHTQAPLKSFKIVNNIGVTKEITVPTSKKKVEYVFENRDGSCKGLSSYITKNKVNLLYLDRTPKKAEEYSNLIISDIKDVIHKLNVTLLVTGIKKIN